MDNSLYNLKIIKSGDSRIEIYKVSNYAIKTQVKSNNSTGRSGKETVSKKEKEENKKRARKTTLTTTRNNIIRLLKSNPDMNTFITLTFKNNVDYKESKKILNNLFNKLRRENKKLKYIWVLEFGTLNSRLHYHLLTNIHLPKEISFATSKEYKSEEHRNYENKFRKKYWQHGFIDIRNLESEGNTNIALYISCYIVKDMLDINLNGYRVYGYSNKTLVKPIESKIYDNRSIEELLHEYSKDFYITFNNSYPIGYRDYRGNHTGTINYFDLVKKNSN